MIYPGYLHRINSIFSLLPLLRVRRSQDRFPVKEFEIKTRIRGDKGRDFSDFLIKGILQISRTRTPSNGNNMPCQTLKQK